MKRHTFKIAGAVFLLAAVLCAPATAQRAEVATANVSGGSLYWNVHVGYDGLELTVSGEGRYVARTFESGETPSFSLFDAEGQPLPDGTYKWELVVLPELRELKPEEFENLRSSIDGAEVRQARAPERQVASGAFSVRGGQIVNPDLTEAPDAGPTGQGNVLSTKDVVFSDDMIVQRSLCVGFDCINGENFGFDTIRLKENNLRIKFEDTSAGSFPTSDWEIEINSSASGGLSYFRVDDVTAGRSPFTLEANAPSHSLYVDDGGRVGFGTSTPVVELHVKTGDSPTLRLEQDTSSGFGAQVWDVAGNEANFFVRSATTGSQLPFRIRPGAPTSSIDIAANGNVGVGTASPSDRLHVVTSSDPSANGGQLFIENTNATSTTRTMLRLKAAGRMVMRLEDTANTNQWNFISGGGANSFIISENNTGLTEMELDSNGNLEIRGTLTTNGPQCSSGCDRVFSPDFELDSIEEHAAQMWEGGYLPAVGPTLPDTPMNLSEKTGGILNELEKAHIYIEQLHERLARLEAELAEQ